jgi:hypothetical protein
MAKEIAKQAGLAAVENLLQGMMPQLLQRIDGLEQKLNSRLDRIEQSVDRLEVRMKQLEDDLRHLVEIKTEAIRETVVELGMRIAQLDGKVEMLAGDRRAMDQYIERIVKLEMAQRKGRRKAS